MFIWNRNGVQSKAINDNIKVLPKELRTCSESKGRERVKGCDSSIRSRD